MVQPPEAQRSLSRVNSGHQPLANTPLRLPLPLPPFSVGTLRHWRGQLCHHDVLHHRRSAASASGFRNSKRPKDFFNRKGKTVGNSKPMRSECSLNSRKEDKDYAGINICLWSCGGDRRHIRICWKVGRLCPTLLMLVCAAAARHWPQMPLKKHSCLCVTKSCAFQSARTSFLLPNPVDVDMLRVGCCFSKSEFPTQHTPPIHSQQVEAQCPFPTSVRHNKEIQSMSSLTNARFKLSRIPPNPHNVHVAMDSAFSQRGKPPDFHRGSKESHKPSTLDPKPQTPNPKPKTQNPKSQTQNPKPQTSNLRQTPNPDTEVARFAQG